ncbi:hypothetical protein [Flavobacterium alkalisoli]|uniref:hypothetical protein n=1 Tax=Flavobacterium alkalisoli TaxID=2602769 RepID=UPI00197A8FDF|nr:hypothetical protein [Flavobacterium alkalisoli]
MIDKKYEKLIKQYEQHCTRIEQATFINIHENPADKNRRIKELEKEYVDWFEWYFPMYAKSKCAKFHRKLAKLIIENDIISLLAEIYRSGAKSVHIDMGIPLFLYVTKRLKFMLLIGKTDQKSKKLIADIQAQLQYNQRFINDYGRKFKYGDWSSGDFTTSDGVKFMCLSIGQDPRGLRVGAERPDYIAVDDVDSKKRCKNDKLSREAYEWVWEDLQGCFDEGAKRRRFIVANNNFHPNTIINQAKKEFKNIIAKAKEAGRPIRHFIVSVKAVKDLISFEPSWPEKTSAEYWRQKFDETPERSFKREYMHEHVQDGEIFKNEHLRYKPRLKLREYDGLVFYGDLSYKDNGDFKSLVLVGKKGREYHRLLVFCRRTSRTNAAKWLYDMYEKHNLENYNIRYYIEGLFAMDEFVNDFDTEGDLRGYHIPVVADKKSKTDKFDRIESMQGIFERGNMYTSTEIQEDPDSKTLDDQLLAFEKGSTANDDGPDSLQSAIAKLNAVTYVDGFETRTTSRRDIINRSKNRY